MNSRTDERGTALYVGIRYGSRFGDFEWWAAFDGARVELHDINDIRLEHPALRQVTGLYNIGFG